MLKIFLALMFLTVPVLAEENYVVTGDDVYKIEQTTKDAEIVSINKKLASIEPQIMNLETTINDYQTLLDAENVKKANLLNHLNALNAPDDTVENVIVDESIYP